MRSSRKGSSLLLLLLLCLTAATLVHPSSATAVCGGGDCQDVNTRVATNNDDPHDHESTETDVKNVIETTPGDDASVSNDDKLQDGFSSTHLPPRTDENDGDGLILSDRHGEHNSNVTFGTADVDDRDDEQQKMPPSPGWTFIDTIVAIFFVVAALWLIAATLYSIMLIILIRLQARGELDIYDEDLGRFTFCGGRYSLHFGCIVRRYAIQLERDYQRRLHQRFGGSSDVENGEGDPYEPAPIRIMTREERRQAVEVLLGIKPGKSLQTCNTTLTEVRSDKESDDDCDYDCKEHNACRYNKAAGPVSPCRSVNSSNDGPVCSICLDSYSSTDVIFKSHKCTHMFHKDCLMEWLERRSNTECPCCRDSLVSDEEVWETVKLMRKEMRRKLRKENSYTHRFIYWMISKRRRQRDNSLTDQDRSSTSSMDSGTAEDDQGSPIETRLPAPPSSHNN